MADPNEAHVTLAAAWLARSHSETQRGRPARAAAALRRALRLAPGDAAQHRRCGEMLLRLRRPRLAIAESEAALRLDPDDPQNLRLAGLVLCCRRRFDEAARLFAAWTERRPEAPEAWRLLARARLLAGGRNTAREAGQRLLALDPNAPANYLLMARIAEANDNVNLRLQHLKAAADLLPQAVTLRLTLAELMLRRLKVQGAMGVAREAQAIAPGSAAVQLVLARCHLVAGQFSKARALIGAIDPRQVDPEDLAKLRAEFAARSGGGPQEPVRPDIKAKAPAAGEATPASPEANPAGEPKPPAAGLKKPASEPKVPAVGPKKAAVEPKTLPAAIKPSPDKVKIFVRPPPLVQPVASPPADVRSKASDRFDEPWLGDAFPYKVRPIANPGLIDNILIVRALILRDLRQRYRKSRLGALIELIRPIMVVLAHYYLFWLVKKPMPGEIPIVVYVLAGFSSWFAFSATEMGASNDGTWSGNATALPGITGFHLRVAKAIWPLMLNLVFCLVALIPLNLYGCELPLPAIPLTVLVFAIAGCMGFGYGILTERLSVLWPIIKTVEKLMSWVLYVTAGLYFSLATMPPVLAAWFWYNPMIHLIEYERHAFDPGYPVALLDLRYPALVMLGLLGSGLVALRCITQPAHD